MKRAIVGGAQSCRFSHIYTKGVHCPSPDRRSRVLVARNVALSYEMHRQLEGTVEADDRYRTAGDKGQAKTGGKQSLYAALDPAVAS